MRRWKSGLKGIGEWRGGFFSGEGILTEGSEESRWRNGRGFAFYVGVADVCMY